ncbi:MAG: ATP-dependent DNA helicase RecG [Nocardioidaceae bacterium]
MTSLDTKLDTVIGGKTKAALTKAFGMVTVGDLLRHYPRRLEDRGKLTDLSDLQIGEHVTVLAKTLDVKQFSYRPRGGGRRAVRTEVIVTDGNHLLTLTFFGQPWQKEKLEAGTVAFFSGKVGVFRHRRQLQQPTYEQIPGYDLDQVDGEPTKRWWPIYPATSAVSSLQVGKAVGVALDALDDVAETLPDSVREQHELLRHREALELIHRPATPAEWKAAVTRLKFDEAFALQTVLAQRRWLMMSLPAIPRPNRDDGLRAWFDRQLPFQLTKGQAEIGAEIRADLSRGHPMHRLLQGEVGSGKTVVALRAMLQVVDAGGQAALLAPTEVLAAQHHRSVLSMLGAMGEIGMLTGDTDGTRVELVTGSMSVARRRKALLDVASGGAGIVIGTHALLEERVRFADLGLVVVDEQHRFGVEQRAALVDKAGCTPPHVLVMTATPIPRTIAMTVFGDLDVSTLRDLPRGRAEIQSTVVPVADMPRWLDRVWQRVREEVEAGHQVYVVCPRIGGEPEPAMPERVDDEDFIARRPPTAVADMAATLVDGPLSGLRVFMLHGRMPVEEKDDLMRRFAAGDVDVLVATTVIEVGVDVANASVMVIMDAERFGVSQLHQLRGRVGRGSVPGLCLLVTESPDGSASRSRLDKIAATSDGFELSRLDLTSRREGDVLGASQSGRRSSLRLLSVIRDEGVITSAREAATDVVAADPLLDAHLALAEAVRQLEASQRAEYLDKS